MKMIDRIRKVRETQDAREFVEVWNRCQGDESRMTTLDAVMLTNRGVRLNRAIQEQVAEHIHDLCPGGSVHPTRARLLALEVSRARDRALTKEFPEFVAFLAWVKDVLTERRETAAG
ncbi:MAG TPA: hypothetical protein VF188_07640 [Longimicrobiales bacterium]